MEFKKLLMTKTVSIGDEKEVFNAYEGIIKEMKNKEGKSYFSYVPDDRIYKIEGKDIYLSKPAGKDIFLEVDISKKGLVVLDQDDKIKFVGEFPTDKSREDYVKEILRNIH